MDLGLQGRVAWVLGASSGLGRASARALAAEGASVGMSARRVPLLQRATAELEDQTGSRCLAVPLDVSDIEAIPAAAREVASALGPIDVLVANAGGPPPGEFDALDDDTLTKAFDLTVRSAWALARSVTGPMKEHRRGCLIFLTSWSTKEVIPGLLLSNMLRASVVGMAKTLSKELGPHGIRTVCVAPGKMATPRLDDLDEATAARTGASIGEVRAANHKGIPLRRYGDAQEFGDVVAFLASERASYVTGTSVVVDGGLLNGLLA